MITKRNPDLPSKRKFFSIHFLILGPIAVLFCWWGARQIKATLSEPQAIFVLGGSEDREHLAAQLALLHPRTSIWISSGSPSNYIRKIFRHAGIEQERLHLDYEARDTVSNFTTMVDEFKSQKIDNIYLVTSDYHMRRAYLIGEIILGSRGIVSRPVSVKSQNSNESWKKSFRDVLRSILWLVTGSTGRD